MPMRVRYTVFDGEIVSENRGGVERDYVPNPLGSTVELLDNTQTKTDGWTYWPYGEVKTRSGTNATPFQYNGTWGYYQDSSSRDYVRARELDVAKGRWLSEDPIGFRGADWNLHAYAVDSPTSFKDPSGLQTKVGKYPSLFPRSTGGPPVIFPGLVGGGGAVINPGTGIGGGTVSPGIISDICACGSSGATVGGAVEVGGGGLGIGLVCTPIAVVGLMCCSSGLGSGMIPIRPAPLPPPGYVAPGFLGPDDPCKYMNLFLPCTGRPKNVDPIPIGPWPDPLNPFPRNPVPNPIRNGTSPSPPAAPLPVGVFPIIIRPIPVRSDEECREAAGRYCDAAAEAARKQGLPFNYAECWAYYFRICMEGGDFRPGVGTLPRAPGPRPPKE